MDSIIKLENVSFVYSKKTPFEHKALDNISCEFEKGKITGIIGQTGSGKSTLAQMFNGLVKPTSGKVYVDGIDIWDKPKLIKNTRFKVGLVFQYPEYQLFDDTVAKDVAYGPRNLGLDEEKIKQRVIDSLRIVGLDESVLDISPFDLSGGQKRRVAIAGIMAMKPEILVLDEPASGLDPSGRDSIFEQILKYKEETDSTIIIISHSMEDVAKYCDNLIVLYKSKIHMSGTVKEVFSNGEELLKIGLNVPQSTRILIELKQMGYPVNITSFKPEDAADEISKLLDGRCERG